MAERVHEPIMAFVSFAFSGIHADAEPLVWGLNAFSASADLRRSKFALF